MNGKGLTLVLSGGAARCIAHLGVLQALEEEGIKPERISGVSGGAIVGAFYCNGYGPKDTLEIIKETSVLRALRPTWSPGLLKLDRAEDLFKKYLKKDTFEKLDIPLYMAACTVGKPRTLFFSEGQLIPPLLASCAMPPVFRPIKIDGQFLADGGLVNNLPVDPVKDQGKILGVNVNIVTTNASPDSFARYTEWVLDVVVNQNIQENIKRCDLFLEPPGLEGFHLTDIGKADELFAIGYEHTNSRMEKVREMMG